MSVTEAIQRLVYELRRCGIADDGQIGITLPTHQDGMAMEMQLKAENNIVTGHLVGRRDDPNSLEIRGVKVVWPDPRRTRIVRS